ncbi:LPP20 family lipoprotein [Idiomarina tyrosinivorans]|nr:LPP20 family lipoprotein [Idiomarina tyrosinivorans]
MKKFRLISAVSLLILAGCASNGGRTSLEYASCTFPDAPEKVAPTWVCDQPVNDVFMQAVGYSKPKQSGVGVMKDIAAQEARNRLAQNFAQTIASEYSRFVKEEATTDTEVSVDKVEQVIQSNVAMNLVYSRIYRTQVSPSGGMYVLVGINKEAYDENVKRLFNNPMDPEHPELFQQFMVEKSQATLDETRERMQ